MNTKLMHRINAIEAEMDNEHGLPVCCNHNCREGRDCPARKARMEQREIGYESGGRVPDPPPAPKLRDRIDPQAVVIFLACIATWVGVYLASVWPLH